MNSKKIFKKRRDVVVVGMKLTPGGRELLTWSLAKFTKPGDEVVALHIVPKLQLSPLSSAKMNTHCDTHSADSKLSVMQREAEGIFDSVAGVYDGFCNAKQIKLQLKVICGGSSVRGSLVEEVKHYNAIRLILGAPGKQHTTENSSFALAKYYSSHFPSTCSVLVIQHGQVVMEKAGVLTSGDSTKGVQIIKDKTVGQRVSSNARKNCKVQNHDDSLKTQCIRCSSDRVQNISGHIVHPYKYVPPQVQGLQRCILELEKLSTMAATNGSKQKGSIPRINSRSWAQLSNECYLQKSCSANEFNENHIGHDKPVQRCISSDSQQCQRKLTDMLACNRGWPLVKTNWNSSEPFPEKISLGLKNTTNSYKNTRKSSKKSNNETESITGRNRHTTSDIPQGWPLLHQSITVAKLDNAHSRARNMSVVEWVLQLPERSKGALEQSLRTVNQEMHIGSATEDERKWVNFSNQETKHEVAQIDSGTKAEKTLLEKCCQLCKGGSSVAFGIADLEKSTNNFSKDNMIGKGGCSRVYRGVLTDARVVAIKCFDTLAVSAPENEFLTELEVVSSLRHRHIVELLGYCVDNQQCQFLVYNFAAEGNLEQKLHQGDDKAVLPWSIRYKVALGIGEALEYLHNSVHQPVIHRDVKCSNILLRSDFTPQLTDFGLSKWASTSSTFLTCNDVVGTFGYLAPEYFMFGKVSDKADVYSYGVVLLELVSGKHPIERVGSNGQDNLILWAKPLIEDESSHYQVVDRRLEGEYDADQLKNMLIAASLCLQHSPYARPSMNKVLKVLGGEKVELELRQDSMSIDGYVVPSSGDYDIHNHLTMALYGLEDDLSSQAGSDQKVCQANSNKLIEEYLRGRCSRSFSFD